MSQSLHNVVYSVTTQGHQESSFTKMADIIENLSNTINKMNDTIISVGVDKKTGDGLDDLAKKTDKTTQKIGGFFDNLNSKFAGLAGNIPIVGEFIEKAMLALGPWGVAISAIVAGIVAVGNVLFSTSAEIDKVKDGFRGFADSEATLSKMTVSSMALQKTFEDFDSKVFSDNIKVVSNEFGLTQQEALKLNEEIVKISGNSVDPDNIREYATQFAKAGMSAESFKNAMINQKSIGIYMDKGVDSIKEFTLRFNKLSDTGKLAMKNVGINSDEMAKKINSGKITMEQALSDIGKKMGKAGKGNKQTLITEVFGAPGEDAGKNLDKYLQSLDKAQGTMTKQQQERFDNEKKLAEEQEKTTKGLNVIAYKFQNALSGASTKAWSLLAPFVDFFIDSWYQISEFISNLFGSLDINMESVKKTLGWIFNLIGGVFSNVGKVIMLIVNSVKMIGKILGKIFNSKGEFDTFWSDMGKGIDWVIKKIGNLVDIFAELTNGFSLLLDGDVAGANKAFGKSSTNLKAFFGDEESNKTLDKMSKDEAVKLANKKLADMKAYELKAKIDLDNANASNKTTDDKLNKDIIGSVSNSAAGATSSVKNIHIQFEALMKYMGNQIIGDSNDSRKLLELLQSQLLTVVNNTNQIPNK